ncbi:tetratricopeptide repeat protein [Psychrobium sp. 1_MG-2023]|uniref:transglutaminase family protein n=1 Tax=Psychrobium sp. 1_MG-2023 TaxID=3062624 RepID=UPI000C324305|nr:tetratricopeptide repeat protein [Psychrobium sp. 1_MG-2023]MDP2560938.1 tetratricopeptide repeat protein [Psychrobium sp. 1_MG-2023]PKF56010.1 hypothetical protein CW748_11365 [Alteromonadales bacterium alter-6D02]
MQLRDELPDIHSLTFYEVLTLTSQPLCDEQELIQTKQLLEQLLGQVAALNDHVIDEEQRWEKFKELFYGEWDFEIDQNDYFSIKSNSIYHFVESRVGNNALSTLFVSHLLTSLNISHQIIDFPGPFILEIDVLPGQFIDPLNGDVIDHHYLECLVRGHLGDHVTLEDEHLLIADELTVKKRFLVSLKQACMLEDDFEMALLLSELLLGLLPDDPDLIMERGFILQQLEYFVGAAQDFAFFIENCPEHPNTDVLKLHLTQLENQAVVTH